MHPFRICEKRDLHIHGESLPFKIRSWVYSFHTTRSHSRRARRPATIKRTTPQRFVESSSPGRKIIFFRWWFSRNCEPFLALPGVIENSRDCLDVSLKMGQIWAELSVSLSSLLQAFSMSSEWIGTCCRFKILKIWIRNLITCNNTKFNLGYIII